MSSSFGCNLCLTGNEVAKTAIWRPRNTVLQDDGNCIPEMEVTPASLFNLCIYFKDRSFLDRMALPTLEEKNGKTGLTLHVICISEAFRNKNKKELPKTCPFH